MEEALLGVVTTINNYLSNYILIILLLGMGIWFTVRTKAIQFRCFGEGWRRVFGNFSLRGGNQGGGMTSLPGAVHRYRGPGGHGQHRGRVRRHHRGRPGRHLLDVDIAPASSESYGYDLKTDYGEIKVADHKLGEVYYTFEKEYENWIRVECSSGDIIIRNKK